jgi:hypothetical protein
MFQEQSKVRIICKTVHPSAVCNFSGRKSHQMNKRTHDPKKIQMNLRN